MCLNENDKQLKENVLKEKSFDFALNIVQLYIQLTEARELIMSKQLLRAGTAIGAMVRESQNAESKADFIHKLSIAQKECDETLYWLELLFKSKILNENQFSSVYAQAGGLYKILKSILLTMKEQVRKK